MKLNKQAFKLANVSEQDYLKWCKENKKAAYKPQTKAEFFARIQDGRLVKETKTGKVIKKYRRKK